MRRHAGILLIALGATWATVATLGPAGGGPGVTCDELYHVSMGKRLVAAWRSQGLGFFRPENIRRNFPWRTAGPPVQAPLGHWILGAAHRLFDPAPDDPAVVSIAAARFAPAIAFGLLVLLIGLWTTRVEGPLAGTVAAAAVMSVPRVFAHAHFAALDMLTALLFVAAVLAVAHADARGGRGWHFALAGVVGGLAMLTRLHGELLLPVLAAWIAWRKRRRALVPLLAWGATATVTLYAGWPWLWLAPLRHLGLYLSSGTGRATVNAYYMDRVWAAHDVPWHYPVVMFLAVVPLGWLLLGCLGLWAKRPCRMPAEKTGPQVVAQRPWTVQPQLLLVAAAGLLLPVVLAVPGVPVYDGVRLLLPVFPLWAVAVGIGAKWIVQHPAARRLPSPMRLAAAGAFLALQTVGLVVYHPCQLSHYSLLVGGLAGAQRLGFEVSYWGDAVSEPLLREAAVRSDGRPLLFAPQLAPWQAAGAAVSSPALCAASIPLVGWDPGKPNLARDCRLAVVYHRRADLQPVRRILERGKVVQEYALQGVWLSRLVELPRRRADPPDPRQPGQATIERAALGPAPSTNGACRLELGEHFAPSRPVKASTMSQLSHFSEDGSTRMVDVGGKQVSRREARASGRVRLKPETLRLVRDRKTAKGNVLEVARLAGIAAAKRTAEWIPLCHVVPLDAVEIAFDFPDGQTIAIEATARATARTGVEMEVLTAVSAAALTIYDMCKSVDRGMVIQQIQLEEKSGGRSGHFVRSDPSRRATSEQVS